MNNWRRIDYQITVSGAFLTGLGWPGGHHDLAVFVGSVLLLLSIYPTARARAEENP